MKLKALVLAVLLPVAGPALANTSNVGVYGTVTHPGTSLGQPSLNAYASGSASYSVNTGSGTRYGSFSDSEDSNNGSLVGVGMANHGLSYSAQAYAENGATHAKAATTYAPDGGYSGYSNANANASYSDWFVITGGSGMAWATLAADLDGRLAGGGNGSASVNFNIYYTPQSYCWDCDLSRNYQSVIYDSQSINGRQGRSSATQYSGEFAFTYDQPFQLTTTLSVSAYNGGSADYFNTGTVTGFTLPAGAQMQSGSGLFVSSVPEPESYALLLSGLGLIGFMARRRQG